MSIAAQNMDIYDIKPTRISIQPSQHINIAMKSTICEKNDMIFQKNYLKIQKLHCRQLDKLKNKIKI